MLLGLLALFTGLPTAFADPPILRLLGDETPAGAPDRVLRHFVRTGTIPLTILGSYDPDGTPLNVQWTQVPSQSTWTGAIPIINGDQKTCLITLPAAAVGHRIRIRVTISDGTSTRSRDIELRPSDAIQILPLGDSITEAVRCYGSSCFHRSYRRWLWEDLVASGQSGYVDFTGTKRGILGNGGDFDPDPTLSWDKDHQGYSGWRTDEMLFGGDSGRLADWLQSTRPDIVLLHMGTNDAIQEANLNAARDNLGAMIDTLRADNPSVIVLLAQLIPCNITPQARNSVNYLNSIIPPLATAKSTFASPVFLVDQFNSGAGNHLVDGIHPDATGEALMADAWFDVLSPLIQLPPDTVPVRLTDGDLLPLGGTIDEYDHTIAFEGGTGPYTWQGRSGEIPPGLTLDQTGRLSGIPTLPGEFTLGLRLQDATGSFDDRFFTIFIEDRTPVIPPGIPIAAFDHNLIGSHASFDAAPAQDTNGVITTYLWDFGDGTTATNILQLSHTFPAPGDYDVSLTVIDNDTLTNTLTNTLTIGANDTSAANSPSPFINLALQTNAVVTGSFPGDPRAILYDPVTSNYVERTLWNLYGGDFQENLGVVSPDDPEFWRVEWPTPRLVNYITFGGSYTNQPQADTAWILQARQAGTWNNLSSGLAGWFDGGTLEWGGTGQDPITTDAIRLIFFSWDDAPLVGTHLRARGGQSILWNDRANDTKATLIQYLLDDIDSDGLPDDWERGHGLIVGIDDANLDNDNDGFPNASEWVAGTHPQNPALFQAINVMTRPDAPNNFRLRFPLVADRLFQVESSSGLEGAPWVPETDPFPGFSDRPWQVPLPAPSTETRFYRLRVQVP